MNEYSKLPLTYAKTAEPLNVYVNMLTGVGVKSVVESEDGLLTPEAAETAAAKALDQAMVGVSSSLAASGVGAMGITKKQMPRKREANTRKDKAPPRFSKKAKKPQDGSNIVPSSTISAALVKTTNTESATKAAQTGIGALQNAST